MTLINSGRELDEPLQVPIKTAAQMLGFSRQTLYKMRAEGQITFGCMRSRAMVPVAELYRIRPDLADEIKRQLTRGKPPKRDVPIVYFLDCGPYTKIGYTAVHARARIRSIEGGNPFAMRLWVTIPGSMETEAELHRYFGKYRHRKEWFKFDDEARAEVLRLARQRRGKVHSNWSGRT